MSKWPSARLNPWQTMVRVWSGARSTGAERLMATIRESLMAQAPIVAELQSLNCGR
jgi:hypothetical protein